MTNEQLQLDVITDDLKVLSNSKYECILDIAKRIHYIYEHDLFKPYFADIYDYSIRSIGINRKTVNFYISVINRCYIWLNYDQLKTNITNILDWGDIYTVKEIFEGFNFSQMKSMLSLSDEEIKKLGIKIYHSQHYIEQLVKDYKKNFNKQTVNDVLGIKKDDIQEVQEDQEDKEQTEKVYTFSDKDVNKSCIQNNFIPASSDYEIIFRNNNQTMIKDKKTFKNVQTALKMLRTNIENNSEELFYYAVVKIPKGLS